MRRTNEDRTGDARVATRNFACAVEAPRHGNETTQSSRLNTSDGRSHAGYNRTNNGVQSNNHISAPTTQGGYTHHRELKKQYTAGDRGTIDFYGNS